MRAPPMLMFGMVFLAPSLVAAAPLPFQAILTPLNESGVTGTADLILDGNELTVHVQASGLEPNQIHPQHIHGRLDNGTPIDSFSPTLAQDTDGDGFVELAEGAATYGPVIIPLTSPPGGDPAGFPTAPDGTVDFTEVYDLTDSGVFAGGFGPDQLLPLDLREIVLHGMTVGAVGTDAPGVDDEVDGTAGYKLVLPVASGAIFQVTEVPEPATLSMLAAGLLGLGVVAKRRGKAA